MLEEMDLGDMGPSPAPTPQPSTVWSRGAHGHGHAHDADHDANDSAEDEGTTPPPPTPLLFTICASGLNLTSRLSRQCCWCCVLKTVVVLSRAVTSMCTMCSMVIRSIRQCVQ